MFPGTDFGYYNAMICIIIVSAEKPWRRHSHNKKRRTRCRLPLTVYHVRREAYITMYNLEKTRNFSQRHSPRLVGGLVVVVVVMLWCCDGMEWSCIWKRKEEVVYYTDMWLQRVPLATTNAAPATSASCPHKSVIDWHLHRVHPTYTSLLIVYGCWISLRERVFQQKQQLNCFLMHVLVYVCVYISLALLISTNYLYTYIEDSHSVFFSMSSVMFHLFTNNDNWLTNLL